MSACIDRSIDEACIGHMLYSVDNLYSAVNMYTSRALYIHSECKLYEKENKYVFKRRLNVLILLFSWMEVGRLFHALGPATENARSPPIMRDRGINTSANFDDRSRWWHGSSARLCRHLKTRIHSLNWIRSRIFSKWSSSWRTGVNSDVIILANPGDKTSRRVDDWLETIELLLR
jgi:hypothetical protein